MCIRDRVIRVIDHDTDKTNVGSHVVSQNESVAVAGLRAGHELGTFAITDEAGTNIPLDQPTSHYIVRHLSNRIHVHKRVWANSNMVFFVRVESPSTSLMVRINHFGDGEHIIRKVAQGMGVAMHDIILTFNQQRIFRATYLRDINLFPGAVLWVKWNREEDRDDSMNVDNENGPGGEDDEDEERDEDSDGGGSGDDSDDGSGFGGLGKKRRIDHERTGSTPNVLSVSLLTRYL